MIARGVTPEQAAVMVGEAIAKGETVCAVAEPGGTFTVTTETRADVDPNPTRARPFILGYLDNEAARKAWREGKGKG